MTLKEAVYERHTVRKYTDKPIAADKVELLKNRIKENNEKYGLNIELVTDNGDGVPVFAKLFFAKGVNNYFVLAGKECADLDEKLGYCGSDLMLYAQSLGLNTWWIGLTYNKKGAAKNISSDAKINGIIAVGYGQNSGVQHKMKTAQDVSSYEGEAPEWFKAGIDALLHAPTAMNKMMYTVKGSGNKVSITCNNGSFSGIDLGIGKHHFEVGAGKENFEWE